MNQKLCQRRCNIRFDWVCIQSWNPIKYLTARLLGSTVCTDEKVPFFVS